MAKIFRRFCSRLRPLYAGIAVSLFFAATSLAWAGGGGGQKADTVKPLPPTDAPQPPATSVTPPPAQAGETPSREQAQAESERMMEAWHKKHPDRHWDKTPPHAPKKSPNPSHQQDQTYGNFTERDEQIWQASLDSFVARGKAIFHDASLLGSTTAISCDMCHPDAANTHPETYPKFQHQLGRIAMLRDMINWCLQNPVRAKPFADDDEKMKAMEAYIIYQRGGMPLDPGKH